MNQIFNKIESSFRVAMKGQENVQTIIWWWGATAYVVSYFIIDRIVKINDLKFFDITLSLLMVIYFGWHIYVLRKCAPKKPQLSKEEKERIRQEEKGNRSRKFFRKLLLQEPITSWDPVFITIVIDAFCIAHFLGYVLR
jgi:hypothetical protein